MEKNDFLVLEVSNRQLTLTSASPHVAVVTNITPNHLDDHGSFKNYVAVKENILKFQSKNDFAVLNYDNRYTKGFAKDSKAQVWYFSLKNKRCIYWSGDNEITIQDFSKKVKIERLKPLIFGEHNKENILAATIASYLAGASSQHIEKGINTFGGAKHRLELVRDYKGIKYYNDSQSTSSDSLCKAIESFSQPLILIAGGFRKNPKKEEYKDILQSVKKGNIKKILLIGLTGKLIADILKNTKIDLKYFDSLDLAVMDSHKISSRGDVIVMSPGAESFGMFKDYRERGKRFCDLVKKLK